MSLQVPCATPSSNFWELEVCDFCDISPPPQKADTQVAPPAGGGDRPPEERLCWGGLGESGLGAATGGGVLQALVGAQQCLAVGAVVVHVLQGIHAEGDEAAARDAPQQAQAPA